MYLNFDRNNFEFGAGQRGFGVLSNGIFTVTNSFYINSLRFGYLEGSIQSPGDLIKYYASYIGGADIVEATKYDNADIIIFKDLNIPTSNSPLPKPNEY